MAKVDTPVDFLRLVYRVVLDLMVRKAKSEACQWGECAFGHPDCRRRLMRTDTRDLVRRVKYQPGINAIVWEHLRSAMAFATVDSDVILQAQTRTVCDVGTL